MPLMSDVQIADVVVMSTAMIIGQLSDDTRLFDSMFSSFSF